MMEVGRAEEGLIMPVLVRFLVTHAVIGIALAIVFVGALVVFDAGGIGTLMLTSADGLLALVVLTFGLGVTFGSVQMGFAVMLMSDTEEPPRGRRIPLLQLTPRAVKVSAGRG